MNLPVAGRTRRDCRVPNQPDRTRGRRRFEAYPRRREVQEGRALLAAGGVILPSPSALFAREGPGQAAQDGRDRRVGIGARTGDGQGVAVGERGFEEQVVYGVD